MIWYVIILIGFSWLIQVGDERKFSLMEVSLYFYQKGWHVMNVNDVVLYRDEKHEVLCIYDNNYMEIRELDSIRRNIKLVHQSAVQLFSSIKKSGCFINGAKELS